MERPMPFVPRFYEGALGTPRYWNNRPKPCYWSHQLRQRFQPDAGGVVDPSRFMDFLALRMDCGGKPIRDKIGDPADQGAGWYRCQWRAFDEAALLTEGFAQQIQPRWATAWHGCKLEALYSIMYHGRLLASNSKDKGHRFFPDAPGIYVHKDGTKHKAAWSYSRFVPLFEDGVFWAAVWEVRVDRARKVPKSGTDQWVQQDGSAHLEALWLRGVLADEMELGSELSEVWNPLLEADPRKQGAN